MRRDLRVHVAVNRVERRALELAARDAGRSPSEYVRELVRAALHRVYRFILSLPAKDGVRACAGTPDGRGNTDAGEAAPVGAHSCSGEGREIMGGWVIGE